METDFASFLGGSGGGASKQFGRSEAHATIDGDINFGGSSWRQQIPWLVLGVGLLIFAGMAAVFLDRKR